MKPTIASAGALLVALANQWSKCALNPGVRQVSTPKASLIFVYFDVEKSPYALRTVLLTQNEKAGIDYRQSAMRTYTDGLFFMEDLPSMRYHIPFFMAGNVRHIYRQRGRPLRRAARHNVVFRLLAVRHLPRERSPG